MKSAAPQHMPGENSHLLGARGVLEVLECCPWLARPQQEETLL